MVNRVKVKVDPRGKEQSVLDEDKEGNENKRGRRRRKRKKKQKREKRGKVKKNHTKGHRKGKQ